MKLAAFDIGGSAVKYGLWTGETLSHQGQFTTPDTFEDMKHRMKEVIDAYPIAVEGVAMSAPGAVNAVARQIEGISAVEYLHHFPIYDAFEEAFGVPVTIENDANCAGIAEIELGAGKGYKDAVFIVLGTGVGGSVFINGKIHKGAHLFGGEFGLMTSRRSDKILSSNGTIVKVALAYEKETGKKVNGKDIFDLMEAGDVLATRLVNDMYEYVASALFNIQVSLDPELVIIGGGVSARKEIATEIGERLQRFLTEERVGDIMPDMKVCEFANDANLVGAAMNFINVINESN